MKFSIAIAISVGVHVLLGVGLWLYMEYAPAPDVLVSLDLSSVELSFAEQEDDAASVLPQMPTPELPMPASQEHNPSALARDDELLPMLPPKERNPSALARDDELFPELPPIPDAVDIPKPEEKPEVKTPDIPKPEKKPDLEKKVEPKPTPAPSAPTPAVAPKQAKIDAPPRPKRTIKPDYPRGSRQRGEQGDVLVEMSVNAEGHVEHVTLVTSCGFPELDEAAMRAVRAARFVPAKSGGKPVTSSARIKLTFKLK